MVLRIDLHGKNDKVPQFAYKNQTLSPTFSVVMAVFMISANMSKMDGVSEVT